MKITSQGGLVLVTTLLFVFIITLLVLSIAENNILENRVRTFFQNKMVALQAAESGLFAIQRQLTGQPIVLPNGEAKLYSHTEQVAEDSCQRKIFLVTVTAIYHRVEVTLESAYLLSRTLSLPNCKTENNIIRLWWRQRGEG